MYKARSNNCRDITIMQTKVTPRQKMKRQVNFIFLANCISQTMDKEMWISVFMHWRIQVMGPGGHRAPPLIPLIFQAKLRPEGPRKFFLETFPPPRPPGPPFLKVWIRFYYVPFLLFTPRIKLPIKWRIMMSYGFQYFGFSARSPLCINYSEKTTERVSDQTAQESWGSEFREVLKSMHNPPSPAALKSIKS